MQGNQRQTHWAYIAGVIDSDGCFMIMRHKRKTIRKDYPHTVEQWAWSYMPAVKIAQIEREAIDFIMKETGFGTMYLSGARPSRPNSLPIYQWGIRRRTDLLYFLEKLIPFLLIKKHKAEFLLQYCKTLKPGRGYFGIPKEELDYREQSYQRMRKLNDNKVAAETNPRGRESVCDSPTQ